MPVTGWPDAVDEIIGGDLVVALAYVTPAHGVVVTPVTTLGLRDREAGTITFTTSFGASRKLERIERDPHVALCFHARELGLTARPGVVLAQGPASFPTRPDPAVLEALASLATGRLPEPHLDGVRGWLQREYYEARVPVTVAVDRVVVWPDEPATGAPDVLGTPRPAAPASQAPPAGGTLPRLDAERAARRARRLPHLLLGWRDDDGHPTVVPVRLAGADQGGITLDAAPGLVPPGARRAGLLAHSFGPKLVPQESRLHTGWLEHEGDRIRYAPHTASGYAVPASELVFSVGGGLATKLGYRRAVRAGRVRDGEWVRVPGPDGVPGATP